MKLFKKLLFTSLLLSLLFITFSCNDIVYEVKFDSNGGSNVASQKVKEGQFASLPSTPIYDGHTFVGWFKEQKLENEFKFDEEKINKAITLYAKWEANKEEVEIIVSGVQLPTNYLMFTENSAVKENKRTEYFDRTSSYKVGIDNPFNVKPAFTLVKHNIKTDALSPATEAEWKASIENFEYKVVVSLLNDTTNIDEYIDKIDKSNATVDFSDKAVGKSFEIFVNVPGSTKEDVKYEVTVTEGFNVYKAKDLAYMENRTQQLDEKAFTAWNEFKLANDIDTSLHPSKLILHSDIEIKETDLPEFFFYQESEVSKLDSDYQRAVGSMKDYENMYHRELNENENFELVGNYFTITNKSLREVVREDGKITPEGEVISHATLFRFSSSSSGNATLSDLTIIGNAPRVENAIKSGGQIFVKIDNNASFNAYNLISTCFFITFMPNRTDSEVLLEKCKAYDSFNCFVYNWGCPNLTIKECEMIGAGGPVIIQDHVDPTSENGGYAPNTKVISSNLQSHVVGTEGWFNVVKATSIVPTIKSLDLLFNPFGKSFLKSNQKDATIQYFNLILVNKSGSAQTFTNEKVDGSLRIDDLAIFNYGYDNPLIRTFLEVPELFQAPKFETSMGGLSYGTAMGLFDPTNNQIVDPTNPMYQGDYLCLYYSGMMLVFEYGALGSEYIPA